MEIFLVFLIFLLPISISVILICMRKIRQIKKLNDIKIITSMLKCLDFHKFINLPLHNQNSICKSLNDYFLNNNDWNLKKLGENISYSKNQLGHTLYEILMKVSYECIYERGDCQQITFYSRDHFNRCMNYTPIISQYFLIFNTNSIMKKEFGDFFATCLVKYKEELTIQRMVEQPYKYLYDKSELNLSFGERGVTFGKYLVIVFKKSASLKLINQKEIVVFNTHFSMIYLGVTGSKDSLIFTADSREVPTDGYYLSFLIYKNLNLLI